MRYYSFMSKISHKAKIRVATRQFEFVEVDFEGTSEEISQAYEDLRKHLIGGEGLSEKDFREALDRYLVHGDGDADTYLAMNKYQQDIFQVLKRAFKRIKAKSQS